MHRAILIAWIPCLLWISGAALLLLLVLRMSGGRLEWAKLRRLHRCQSGSVQTLSFVFTLPIFMLLVMFIVQVAELMVGIVGVHYAAFAAARSACVWIPAATSGSPNPFIEPANTLYPGSLKGVSGEVEWVTDQHDNSNHEWDQLWKLRKICGAAAIALVPISPSRYYFASDDAPMEISDQMVSIARALSPALQQYPRNDRVIRRKLNYALANTRIEIRGIDRDRFAGPTYNPYPGRMETYTQNGQIIQNWIPWNPNEVGWEDAMNVTVYHYYALLPGPGRFLSTQLGSSGGVRDTVSRSIVKPGQIPGFGFVNANKYRDKLKSVPLEATVTISNEGLKSVMPYAHPND